MPGEDWKDLLCDAEVGQQMASVAYRGCSLVRDEDLPLLKFSFLAVLICLFVLSVNMCDLLSLRRISRHSVFMWIQ
jgi:hypothetical protein